jgi:hypothetical protein
MGRREGLTIYVLSCNLPRYCLPHLKTAYSTYLPTWTNYYRHTHTRHAHTHQPTCNCHPRRLELLDCPTALQSHLPDAYITSDGVTHEPVPPTSPSWHAIL